MISNTLADLIVLTHLLFILFVVFGGILLLFYRKLIWFHLPAVAWGIWIELSGRLCPLTGIEQRLRHAARQAGYREGFVEHYLLPVIYPEGLTREIQIGLAAVVLLANAVVYTTLLLKKNREDTLR